MGNGENSLLIGVVGGRLGFLQLLVLFVLSDLRSRIMRLESKELAKRQRVIEWAFSIQF
jgi:hypothetical protein